jgi:hypothetical protein
LKLGWKAELKNKVEEEFQREGNEFFQPDQMILLRFDVEGYNFFASFYRSVPVPFEIRMKLS